MARPMPVPAEAVPMGGGGPPPPMNAGNLPPGPGAPPPGAPAPQDVAAAEADAGQAEMEAVAKAAPHPKEPYPLNRIKALVDAVNDFIDALEVGLPPLEWAPPSDVKTWAQPLPPEVFLPMFAIFKLAADSGFGDKYPYDLQKLETPGGLAECVGLIKKMAKDKKLIEAAKGMEGGGPPNPDLEENEAPPPQEEPPDEVLEAV